MRHHLEGRTICIVFGGSLQQVVQMRGFCHFRFMISTEDLAILKSVIEFFAVLMSDACIQSYSMHLLFHSQDCILQMLFVSPFIDSSQSSFPSSHSLGYSLRMESCRFHWKRGLSF